MNKKVPFILLIAFSTLFILFFYHDVIFHPNDYLFNNEGDGIKNYYTYCYHIKNDTSYIDFRGMNYPYGEHFLYTDCHPLLSNLLKLLASNYNFFNTYSVGILNLLLLLGIYATFYACYLLLKEFNKNEWLIVLFSIAITVLSPQLFRIVGHYALSYSFAIPLSWFLLIRIFKSDNKRLYILLLFLNNLFWLFTHAYLGVIILFFLTCIVGVNYLFETNRWKTTLHYLQIMLSIILPMAIFYLFAKVTDTHTGRTDNPSGFFLYNAEPDDIFLPSYAPLRPVFDVLAGNKINLNWEARSYVGFATTVFVIALLVSSIYSLIKRRKSNLLVLAFESRLLSVSLIASIFVLLFAMAIPFKQLPSLVDMVPFVKQFRATGRFAWPFYFAMTVFTATALEKLYLNSKGKKNNFILLMVCILSGLFTIIESGAHHSDMATRMVRAKNIFKEEFLTDSYRKALQSFNPNDFQAAIPLPFKYHGSESYARPSGFKTIQAYTIISYYTGMPLVTTNLTRISVQESKNIVQLMSPDFYKKELQKDIPNDKPFLVIRTKDEITEYEKLIFNKCSLIYKSDEVSLYSISKEALFKSSAQQVYDHYKNTKPDLFTKGEFYLTKDSSFLYYNNYDSLQTEKPFRGRGGIQSIKKGTTTFAEFAPNTFVSGKQYHVSLWMYNGYQDALNMWFRFIIEEYNEETDTWKSTVYFPEMSEVINGNWSLVEGTFTVKNPRDKIFIRTKGKDDATQPLFADELLIRESGVDVYKQDNDEFLFYNNHDVPLRSAKLKL